MKQGILLAIAHVVLALSVAGKFAYDRETLPRVWVQTAPVDPYLPIRGRYVQLRLLLNSEVLNGSLVTLAVENGQLVGRPASGGEGLYVQGGTNGVKTLNDPVAFFIPENVPDPSRRALGEQLWVEVSVPSEGLPRPVRLGVKKDGVLTPLDLR
ncbi:MAG: GDYXXLXY domain-containing protein [Acidobacteriota bacterium]